jgi:hypothetical protein
MFFYELGLYWAQSLGAADGAEHELGDEVDDGAGVRGTAASAALRPNPSASAESWPKR